MALIKCPECSNEVSDKATSCPKCGHPLQAAAPQSPATTPLTGTAQRRTGYDPKNLSAGYIIFFLAIGILAIIVLAIKNSSSSSDSSSVPSPTVPAPPPSQVSDAPLANIPWSEADAIYNLKSKNTDLQKDEAWKRYKGKKVRWTGTVSSVSDSFGSLNLQVKMNPDTFTSDLLITLKDSQKSRALSLTKGDSVTFTGILDRWGSLLPITLREGEISP